MDSILWQEIHEQPDVIRQLVENEFDHILALGDALRKEEFRFLFLVARGTSDNAARYGQYLFGSRNGLPVALAAPSLFTKYHTPPSIKGALAVGISQSGQSPDIVEVLAEAKRQGAFTIAVTNEADSPLAHAAADVISLSAGKERSIAATKTYTAQLAVMAMLSLALTGELRKDSLQPVLPWMEDMFRVERQVEEAAKEIADAEKMFVLGRGFHYCTAHECSLKIKELSGVGAEPYSTADFLHGPRALAEGGVPVLIISVGATFRGEMADVAEALHNQGARIFFIGDAAPREGSNAVWIPAPAGEPEWLTPLAAIISGQLLAFHLAHARGLDPDNPRFIHKVTRTR